MQNLECIVFLSVYMCAHECGLGKLKQKPPQGIMKHEKCPTPTLTGTHTSSFAKE